MSFFLKIGEQEGKIGPVLGGMGDGKRVMEGGYGANTVYTFM
jgi:hypothetical protein